MENFTFVRDGVEETVPRERWGWIALYKDGSSLQQFDFATGQFHQFKEIDLEKLDVFAMQNLDEPENPAKRLEVHIKEGMTPIHFYRNQMLNVGAEDETRVRFYCFGYQMNVSGQSVKFIMKIHPNDAIEILNDDGRPA